MARDGLASRAPSQFLSERGRFSLSRSSFTEQIHPGQGKGTTSKEEGTTGERPTSRMTESLSVLSVYSSLFFAWAEIEFSEESRHQQNTTAELEDPTADTTFSEEDFVCFQRHNCSYYTYILTAILFYAAICVASAALAWYRFVIAWNLITRAQAGKDDNQPISRRKRTLREFLQTHVHVKDMNHHMSCPICLMDFYENEHVTSCEQGCGTWFHKSCLLDWLDRYNDSCPCCRVLIVPQEQPLHPTGGSWTQLFGYNESQSAQSFDEDIFYNTM